jgi:hypothetical protein
MAVLLPSVAYVRTLGTAELVQCGSIQVAEEEELAHIRFLLYKHGALGGTEEIRAKLFTDDGYSKLYATSDWALVSDIENLSTYWWGWIRLDFGRENLSKRFPYYVALETENYTETDDAYLSVSLDWPIPQNTGINTPHRALAMQVYGYRSLYAR